ncbi:MAG TPA: 3-hydroxybutyrate dehydrogenase [Rhodocyclaceae bacterium]|nr:3-hydroxybutyrate dehydrogenase [Rhodocyclaceae bacterium]
MKLNNRVALVTGSTQGIGLAVAEVLAQHGSSIALHGLCAEDEGRRLAAECASRWQVPVRYFPGDLAVAEASVAMVESVVAEHGRLDIVVNNAGIQHTAPLPDFPLDKWDAIHAINLRAPFLIMQQAIPVMRAQGWGRIVNIASVHGLVASINKAAYCATKHGLVGLTRVAALETATDGITVNAICPGWTETPILDPQIAARGAQKGLDRAAAIRDMVAEKQPNQLLMPAAWIGDFVAFLCSDAAAGVTGAALPIDGGWTAQ